MLTMRRVAGWSRVFRRDGVTRTSSGAIWSHPKRASYDGLGMRCTEILALPSGGKYNCLLECGVGISACGFIYIPETGDICREWHRRGKVSLALQLDEYPG